MAAAIQRKGEPWDPGGCKGPLVPHEPGGALAQCDLHHKYAACSVRLAS